MDTRKILSMVFSLVFLCSFGFVLTWGIINFNKVKESMSGTELYTQKDLDNAYEDGYNTALTNEEQYNILINDYRDTITSLNDNISQLNSEVTRLNKNNADYSNQITALTTQRDSLQIQVNDLKAIKSENETTISNANSEIARLTNQIAILHASGEDKSERITQLSEQVANLQTVNQQLQKTNEANSATISNLNNQVINLNKQISDLTLQMQGNNNNLAAMQTKINDLEKSIAYYETYIAQLEQGEQIVATFEFNGSVYNVQIVNKGDIVTVTNPTSTNYLVFNYWMLDGERVDLSTYAMTKSTKFVANITINYDAKFMVDGEEYNNQIIEENHFAIMPENPIKEGYEFDGWSLNGVDVIDPTTNAITQNTTYYAVFTQLHTVSFIYEDEIISTQTIRNGEYSESVDVESTEYKIFNGWKYNDTITNVTSIAVFSEMSFVADISYRYNVYFMVDENVVSSQIIDANSYAIQPTNPVKEGFIFNGWSIDKDKMVLVNSIAITKDTTFYALFEEQLVGLYKTDTKELVYSWDELLDNNYLILSDAGDLSAGENVTNLSGDLYLSNDVKKINHYAFQGATNLTGVTVPNTVTEMGYAIFNKCPSLKYLSIPFAGISDNVDEYNAYQNGHASLGYQFYKCSSTTEPEEGYTRISAAYHTSSISSSGNYFIVPNSLRTVRYTGTKASRGGLAGFSMLTKVELANSVTSIEPTAFYNCSGLTSIEIPATVKSIGFYAFGYCSFTHFTVPSTVKSVGAKAFYYCKNLESLYFYSSTTSIEGSSTYYGSEKTPPVIGCSKVSIYTDVESSAARPSGWGNYLSYSETKYSTSAVNTGYRPIYYGYSYEEYLAAVGLTV